MKASNKRGLKVPYAYALDQLAQRWSTNPVWLQEECPWGWVQLGLTFMSIEAEAQKKPKG